MRRACDPMKMATSLCVYPYPPTCVPLSTSIPCNQEAGREGGLGVRGGVCGMCGERFSTREFVGATDRSHGYLSVPAVVCAGLLPKALPGVTTLWCPRSQHAGPPPAQCGGTATWRQPVLLAYLGLGAPVHISRGVVTLGIAGRCQQPQPFASDAQRQCAGHVRDWGAGSRTHC